jgi:integral membrane protein (TIGR01906 family)
LRWAAGYLSALCLLALIIFQSIALPTFNRSFYRYQYARLEIPESIQVEPDELMRVTGEMLDYMRGHRSDLNIIAVVAGEEREFFNQKEKDHMVDVMELFRTGFMIRNIAFWLLLFLILFMVYKKYRILYFLARGCREVMSGFLVLVIFLAVIITVDFTRAFEIFHLIFFNNDLWILDPATDLLINIVPQPFFVTIAAVIGTAIVFLSLAFVGVSAVYLRKVAVLERYPGAAGK